MLSFIRMVTHSLIFSFLFLFLFFFHVQDELHCAMRHPRNVGDDIGCDLHGSSHKTSVSSLSFPLAWHHRLSSVATPWTQTPNQTWSIFLPQCWTLKTGRIPRVAFDFASFVFWVELYSSGSSLKLSFLCWIPLTFSPAVQNCCLDRW